MKLAFVLFHYFPYGGLERDMLAMARCCVARGHQVSIYTQGWDGDKPADIPVIELPVRGLTNHGRASAFVKKFHLQMQQSSVDLVVGFNKMSGLDIYYAADVCFAQKAHEERGWLYRLGGRSRHYLRLEKAVFKQDGKTHILIISPAQIPVFQRYYQTPDERLHLLPPGIKRDRVMPQNYDEQRFALRQQYGLAHDDYVLLMVGSDFRRKGLKRSIHALAALPDDLQRRAQLWVAGLDNPQAFVKLAQKLGVSEKLKILGARDDIPQLMWSADVFLHPAYSEAAGAVLLEAMVAGLPVITTAVCGYAHFIEQTQMGCVLNATDADADLATVIAQVAAQDPQQWRKIARDLVEREDIFSMTEHAAELIERFGEANGEYRDEALIVR